MKTLLASLLLIISCSSSALAFLSGQRCRIESTTTLYSSPTSTNAALVVAPGAEFQVAVSEESPSDGMIQVIYTRRDGSQSQVFYISASSLVCSSR